MISNPATVVNAEKNRTTEKNTNIVFYLVVYYCIYRYPKKINNNYFANILTLMIMIKFKNIYFLILEKLGNIFSISIITRHENNKLLTVHISLRYLTSFE